MDPLTATLGATVGKAVVSRVSGHFIGKMLKQEGPAVNQAIQLALQGLPAERQAIVRPALVRWPKSSDGLGLQNSLNRGLRVTEAMLSRMERYLREDGGLEDQDQPRMVAERYLTVLAKVQVSNGGVSLVIEQGEQLLGMVELLNLTTRTHHQDLKDNLASRQEEILALINTRFQVPLQGTALSETDPHSEPLTRVEHSIQDGAFVPARRRLDTLELEKATFSDAAHARFLRLRGILENREDHPEQAAEYFTQAFEYDTTSASALTLRGAAELLQKRPEEALKYFARALKIDPSYEDALANQVQALTLLDRFEAIDELRLRPLESRQVKLGTVLAQAALQNRQYGAARDVLDQLDHEFLEDSRILLVRTMLSVLPVQDLLEQQPRRNSEIPALLLEHPEVQASLPLLEQAARQLEQEGGRAAELRQAENLIQVVLTWLNRFPEMIEVAARSLERDLKDGVSARHLMFGHYNLGQPEEVWKVFSRFPEDQLENPVRILGAFAAHDSGRLVDAENLLQDLLTAPLDDENHADVVLNYSRLLMETGRSDGVGPLLAAETLEHLSIEVARAEHAGVTGDEAAARAAYTRAMSLGTPSRQAEVTVQFVQYLESVRDRSGAIEHAVKVLHLPIKPDALEWLVRLLVQLEAYAEAEQALDLLETRTAAAGPSMRQIFWRGLLALQAGDAPLAVDCFSKVAGDDPTSARAAMNHARALMAAGRIPDALDEFRRMAGLSSVLPAELMEAAQLTAQHAPELALEWGYRARRVDYQNPALHRAFAFLGTALTGVRDLDRVVAESAVCLHDEDEQEQWLILTADPDPRPERHEYSLDSDAARVLLDSTLGQSVKLREGVGGTVTVHAIITKYAYAERHVFRDHFKLFPTDRSMVVGRFDHPVPTAALGLPTRMMALRQTAQKLKADRVKLLNELNGQGLPASMRAVIFDEDEEIVLFWLRAFASSEPLISYSGLDADLKDAAAALGAPRIMVDLSVLLCLAQANMLDQLPELHSGLHLTKDAVEALDRASREQPGNELLRGVADFVDTCMQVLEVGSAVPEHIENLRQIFPATTLSAIVAAWEHGLPLMTEDGNYRDASRTGHVGPAIPCFGTVDLMVAATRADQLDEEKMTAALQGLLIAGYQLMPVTAELLTWISWEAVEGRTVALQAVLHTLAFPFIGGQYQAETAALLIRVLKLQGCDQKMQSRVLMELTETIQRFQDAEDRFALLDLNLVKLFRREHEQDSLAGIQAELLRLRR